MKQIIWAGLAAAGGTVLSWLGGWSVLLQALLIFMAADQASGLLVAAVFKRSGKTPSGALCSKVGFIGLSRKVGILLMLLVAAQTDKVMNTTAVQSSVMLFFLGNEGLSILENLGLMGVPYPKFLQRALDTLSKQEMPEETEAPEESE